MEDHLRRDSEEAASARTEEAVDRVRGRSRSFGRLLAAEDGRDQSELSLPSDVGRTSDFSSSAIG